MNHPARRLRTPEERVGCLPNACLPPPAADTDERLLARALGAGDEAAFGQALDRLYPAMVRLAMQHVDNRASAEEVVQEAWMAALQGFHQFEHRSAIRTWLFQILRNMARRRGRTDARWRPMSDVAVPSVDEAAPDPLHAVVANAANGAEHGPVALWARASDPEQDVLSRELADRIEGAIAALPARMREVLVLRDVEGWSATEVCNVLGVTDTNQRVILHRARDRVRNELREYLAADAAHEAELH